MRQQLIRCRPMLLLLALLAGSFTLATQLHSAVDQAPTTGGGLMEDLMAETRGLLGSQLLTKADVYLHSGFYPSLFDQARVERRSHLSEEAAGSSSLPESSSDSAHAAHHADEEVAWSPDKPLDWVEAFGRNFLPVRHTHLDETGKQREVLPWLWLAAELDPHNLETYTVAAYWLRTHMGKVREAEEFLRAGWRANPDSYEILFELGRLFQENYRDAARARNLFEAALKRLDQPRPQWTEEQSYALRQITGNLARLERDQGHPEKAIKYLERLQKVSPNPEPIQEQIDELKTKLHLAGATPP